MLTSSGRRSQFANFLTSAMLSLHTSRVTSVKLELYRQE